MPLFMLDTDSVSYALRGQGRVGATIAQHARSEICVSAITAAELTYGDARRGSRRIHGAVLAFLSEVEVKPFDASAATRFGEGAAELVRAGSTIGQMDTLIASHALAIKAVLVSNNERHFARVRGLRLENWT